MIVAGDYVVELGETMKRYIPIICVLMILGLSSLPVAAVEDGNAWREYSQSAKSYFLVGVIMGMDLGKSLTVRSLFDEGEDGCAGKANEAYYDYRQRLFSAPTIGQFRDGLDVFYEDYRNRSITVDMALWVVAKKIAGATKEDIQATTEEMRRMVTKRGDAAQE